MSKILASVEERLEQLRQVVIAKFNFESDQVKTAFRPKATTSAGPTDFIDLNVMVSTQQMNYATCTAIQGFAAEALHKIWPGNRPLVALHHQTPESPAITLDPDAPRPQLPS